MARPDGSPIDLVFVVGARRSGTNFLQRVLASHPLVVAVPSESYLFSHGLAPLVERFHHGAVSSLVTGAVYIDRRQLIAAVRTFADGIFTGLAAGIDPSATTIVERTPDHVRHLDLIGEVYPDAPVLHIIRDGRDVVRSLLGQTWGPESAGDAVDEWRSAVEAGRASAAGLARYREVRYEALLHDPVAQARDLFDWMGMPAGDDVLRRVAAEAGVSFNADPDAPAVAKGGPGGGLDAEQLAVVLERAGSLLRELGYAPTEPTAPVSATATEPSRPRRRWRWRRAEPAAMGQRELMPLIEQVNDVAQRAIDVIGRGQYRDLGPMMDGRARVRVIGPSGVFEERGDAGRQRLFAELAGDDALRLGRQVRGDVHPGVPVATVVFAFDVDGRIEQRVLVLTVYGGRIGEIAWYRPRAG
ncbi:MAG: sulfotransferase family protein [Acidimicrobiales bacterium]|nr:sulfotransferase family protein [Acidimicrobiales bacterium]